LDAISEEILGPRLIESMQETLETMVGCTDVERISALELEAIEIQEHAPSIIAFIGVASGYAGACSVYATIELARKLTAGLLCIDDPSEVSDAELKDAYGELANMICGGLKNRCDADGIHFALSLPVVITMPIRVAPHYPEGVGVTCAAVRTHGSELEVQVCMQPLKD